MHKSAVVSLFASKIKERICYVQRRKETRFSKRFEESSSKLFEVNDKF
jgi:hypothetical protein